jgi:hypothetical protein
MNVGGVNSNANTTPLSLNPAIGFNMINNTTTLNHNSSSINYQANLGGGVQVDNNYSSSVSTPVNNILVSNNTFNGSGNIITVTGSNTANRRQFNGNTIFGYNNRVNSDYIGSTNGHLVSTALLGQNLIVSASHTSNSVGGTVIVGRYNATGSLQESSQDTVFVVGNGTADNNRRNAIRIDNNGNTEITGSVQISGSLLLNGSPVGSGDRNGLITTGSLATDQTIVGQLRISGSASQGLQIGSGPDTAKINVYNSANPFLYHNTTNYSTVIGNNEGASNGFTAGSEKNMIFTGFYLGFNSGSQNTIIAGNGGANFRSGSNNTIIGDVGNLEFGNNNTYVGTGGPNILEDNTLRIGRPGVDILVKSGSNALQVNGGMEITGSLTSTSRVVGNLVEVDCLSVVTASLDLSLGNTFVVLNDVTPSGLHFTATNHTNGQQVTLIISSTGGAQTGTVDSSIKFVGQSTVSVRDGFNCGVGSCYNGTLVLNYQSA